MEQIIKGQENNLSIYRKRIELLVGARYKKTNQITSAVNFQDKLRKKIGHWRGAEEIRKWQKRAT